MDQGGEAGSLRASFIPAWQAPTVSVAAQCPTLHGPTVSVPAWPPEPPEFENSEWGDGKSKSGQNRGTWAPRSGWQWQMKDLHRTQLMTAEQVRPKGAEMSQRGQQVTGMTLEGGSEVRTEPQWWRGRVGRGRGRRQRPVGVRAGGDSRGAPGSWGGSWPVR